LLDAEEDNDEVDGVFGAQVGARGTNPPQRAYLHEYERAA
jgi:hypothetical protein